jgi:predicted dehydrogenase
MASSTSAWAPRDVIRWGIIGCGDVTEVKSGPGFKKSTGSKLVAVMRRNAALAEDYARRHDVPKWYSDADALINDPEVDAVYIATPPGSHLEYTLRVAAAGKPCHVEKPMARNTVECDAMVATFARARLPLFVAYYRRAQPRFLKVKSLLDEGALGQVTHIGYQFTDPRHDAPADALTQVHAQSTTVHPAVFFSISAHTRSTCSTFSLARSTTSPATRLISPRPMRSKTRWR